MEQGTGSIRVHSHDGSCPCASPDGLLTIFIEVFGGLAMLCGAFVNLVAIPAIGLLVVAILTVHLPYGFSSIKLAKIIDGRAQFGPPGYECDLLYIACIVALVMAGPGPWSFDAWHLRTRS